MRVSNRPTELRQKIGRDIHVRIDAREDQGTRVERTVELGRTSELRRFDVAGSPESFLSAVV
jgi:hypothetical protein